METSVAVVGANGHTGRFVVQALKNAGMRPICITRGQSEGSEYVEHRQANIHDPLSMDSALAGAAAVINCAGPFLDTSRPVVEAALRARIHYLDLTAEQPAVLDIARDFDQLAKSAGVVVLPAIAFFGGLADLLTSAVMKDWGHADDIAIGIALEYWHPTRGTRITGERNTATRLIIREGRLVPVPDPALRCRWDFPAPFGTTDMTCVALSEVITISRHLHVSNLTSYLSDKPLQDVRDPNTPPPKNASGNSDQAFVMDVRVRCDGQTRGARAMGHDIYGISAPLIVNACKTLLSTSFRPGVRSPGEVFAAAEMLASLAVVTEYY